MKKFIILAVLTALSFTACSVGGIGDRAVVIDNKITISHVTALPADAATIMVFVTDTETGEEAELVSADIENGTAVLYMPATIDDIYLSSLRADAPDNVELSDPATNYTFLRFMVYNSAGRLTGYVCLESASSWTDLIYVDRPTKVTGTDTKADSAEQQSDIYNLSLVKGYNWTKYVVRSATSESWVSGIPSGAVWNYYFL